MGSGGRGILLAVALAAAPVAQAGLGGDPPVARHAPDIDVYPQNFAVAQDADGIVYVGNFDGVLVYDGERWELVPLPRGELVRSLHHDGRGRIYVGSYDAFGYLEPDATGRAVYHDLTAAFATLLNGETFADIWSIQAGPEGVFFRALRHVFLYRPDTGAVKIWRHAGRFGGLTRLGGAPVLQFRGEGLRRYDGAEWVPIPGTGALRELVSEPVAMPGGGLLLPGSDGTWRVFRDGTVKTFAGPATLPPSASVSGAAVAADGSLAFATDHGAIMLFDPRSGVQRRFRIDPGYLTNPVVARDGGLLVASDDALYHIQWPAPWTMLGTEHGLQSSLHAAVEWSGRWYGLTASGVQVLDTGGGKPPAFRELDWTDAEAWDLEPIDATQALLAETYGVKLVERGRARALTHNALYPRKLQRSRFDADVVFVGTEPGFAVLRRESGAWKLVLELKDLGDPNVMDIVEAGRGVVWLGTERSGAWRLTLSPDSRTVLERRQFGAADGLELGEIPGAHVTQLPGGLLASTEKGFFTWDGQRFARTGFDGLDQVREPDEWLRVCLAPDGTGWAHSYRHLYRRIGHLWQRVEVGGLRRGAMEDVAFDQNSAPIVSSSYALLQFDPVHADSAGTAAHVVLRGVERVRPDASTVPLQVRDGAVELLRDSFSLVLRFAVPDYRRPEAVRYSVRLSGWDEQFSPWSAQAEQSYARLPPGDYRFELRARDSQGAVSTLAPLTVHIVPRWYETVWAQLFWGLLTGAALLGLMLLWGQMRTQRLVVEKLRLEGMVAARTTELETLNRRLDDMARRDALTGVSNRRELDRRLEEVWQRAGRAVSVLAIDVDRFKQYNDTNGHVAGDEMLVRLVRCLTDGLKGGDHLLARYGGDEFFVVLDGLEGDEAESIAEALRRRVQDTKLGTTVSIGVATGHPREGGTIKQLVRAADAALYKAKAAGRNRVVVGESV